jgi:DDE family transposase
MATACIAQSALQVHGISKPIIAKFDQPHASSDGGAILLKAIDERLGLTWRLASAIRDRRQPGKVAHPLRDLLRQGVFGLACGYADCNDAARLVDDPLHKLLLDRDPLEGAGLGSQPTLSRFENAVGRADLYRLGTALADAVLTAHRERLGETRCCRTMANHRQDRSMGGTLADIKADLVPLWFQLARI